MKKDIVICICLLVFGLFRLPVISAWDYDEDRIPNGAVFSCDTCHGNTTHQLNPFGSAYNNAGRAWSAALAQADSDGDGYTNGSELLDPDGIWEIGNPNPGNPGDVTNPGDASSVPPEATPTPGPTATATSAPTGTPAATATPGATATPSDCSETGVTIDMPGNLFYPGNAFYCHVIVCNAGEDTLTGFPLLVLLDVFGQYFFAPGFQESLSFYSNDYLPGLSTVVVLPAFNWPSGAGTADGIIWYAALTDPTISSLVGTMDSMAFGWRE